MVTYSQANDRTLTGALREEQLDKMSMFLIPIKLISKLSLNSLACSWNMDDPKNGRLW